MGDSDEEFDSRRREKFRRERNDYQAEPPAVRVTRPPPRRDEWPPERYLTFLLHHRFNLSSRFFSRQNSKNRVLYPREYRPGPPPPRRDYREYPPNRPRAYSPGGRPLDGSPVSPPPPPKRPRGDWLVRTVRDEMVVCFYNEPTIAFSERPPERGYGFEPPAYGGFGPPGPHFGGDPGMPPMHYPPHFGRLVIIFSHLTCTDCRSSGALCCVNHMVLVICNDFYHRHRFTCFPRPLARQRIAAAFPSPP